VPASGLTLQSRGRFPASRKTPLISNVRHRVEPVRPLLARTIYRWSAFLALPGGLWEAFEMYGLTIGGAQMLFFSVAHTMPFIMLALWLSFPLGAAWLLQSGAALASKNYRERIAVPLRQVFLFAAAVLIHSALLYSYESWSGSAGTRVSVCVLGLALTLITVQQAWQWLLSPRPNPRAKSDA